MNVLPPPIVVQTRPGFDIWGYENVWKEKFCDCCTDRNLCCLVCLACPYATYGVYHRAGESCISCCWPMTLWSLRTKMRTMFRIKGSVCTDCLAVQCCGCCCCAIVQMHHELDLRGC
ncbi:unnamed protein product [Adineta steineri]|uniref:Cornifelin-like protein n=1 Tax=Adineta steineri TaxID=433720 RepID=A0A819CZX6_9BILA|nr:unnamed protein product [Adineta steineri]CAF1042057.1 unnamed protein product [Adineta steineri]CAF3677125.1 unnamed protein product [Adineta steineri]CAF3824906.1 unnamed protein product [Adineta steineri]CAF3826435.1 unnamed protein product [Adineta steineri]